MKTVADPRHTSRTLSLTALFTWLYNEIPTPESVAQSKVIYESEVEEVFGSNTSLTEFIVQGVKENLNKIDAIIQESAPEWPLDKISKIDLVILRIAVFEVVFGKKAPTKVAIDEAVELAKEFGNDTSHKFVNGVLGTVVEKYVEAKEPKTEEKPNEQ